MLVAFVCRRVGVGDEVELIEDNDRLLSEVLLHRGDVGGADVDGHLGVRAGMPVVFAQSGEERLPRGLVLAGRDALRLS